VRSFVRIVADARRLQVDEHVRRTRREVDLLARAVGTGAAQTHAVEADVDGVRVEGCLGRADRGEHAPPVRVVAEDRRLEQVVAGDRAPHLDGVRFDRGVRPGS
jgi:hypothetical protein